MNSKLLLIKYHQACHGFRMCDSKHIVMLSKKVDQKEKESLNQQEKSKILKINMKHLKLK